MNLYSNDPYGLEKIAQSYQFALLDTNALISPFYHSVSGGRHGFGIRDLKTLRIHKDIEYMLALQESLRKGYPFYVIERVMKEIRGGDVNSYRHGIQHCKQRKKFVSPKTIERKQIEKDRLISLLQHYKRVLQLNDAEQEIYSALDKDFSYLKGAMDLSDIDLDYLLSGIVLSRTRGKTALMTNDRGIRESWLDLIQRGIINPLELDLCRALGLGYFVRDAEYHEEKRRLKTTFQ